MKIMTLSDMDAWYHRTTDILLPMSYATEWLNAFSLAVRMSFGDYQQLTATQIVNDFNWWQVTLTLTSKKPLVVRIKLQIDINNVRPLEYGAIRRLADHVSGCDTWEQYTHALWIPTMRKLLKSFYITNLRGSIPEYDPDHQIYTFSATWELERYLQEYEQHVRPASAGAAS